MKKQLLTLTSSLLIAVTGCKGSGTPDQYNLSILCPKGGPTLALYNHVEETTYAQQPTLVKAKFELNEYDVLVFDFYNGLKACKQYGNYKLARIVTAGNLFLVGINHTEEPVSTSRIVSFGRGLLPDLAFNELYGALGARVDYVDGVSDIAPIMKTGKYAGENIDYVVVSEPVITTVFDSLADTSKYTVFSIREKWEEEKGEGHKIPQAGLFINTSAYSAHESVFDTFLSNLDNEIGSAISNPTLIKEAFEKVGDEAAQKDKFSIDAQKAYKITLNGNGVGIVKDYNKTDISSFLSDINIEEDYSSVIL